jgi:hypothetical protein
VACAALLATALHATSACAEWDYRHGFGFSSGGNEVRLNVFVRPRYEYLSNAGSGSARSSFVLDLVGARLRIWTGYRRVYAEMAGGLAGTEGLLLDTFLQFDAGDHLAIRFGYFRVPFDEQTTHAPFWLRMTDRSIAVRALGYAYDVGLALRGTFLDDGLVFGVSVTNGEPLDLENMNIDFLYSGRLAVSVGRLADWSDVDLVIGVGTSWNLEPWTPEEGVRVNRSVLAETLDLTLRLGPATLALAGLYRYIDPGAYGDATHVLGWHVESGLFMHDQIEVVVALAHLVPVEGNLEHTGGVSGLIAEPAVEDQQLLEAAAGLNVFVHDNRIRLQLEYAYTANFAGDTTAFEAHRVVAQAQAMY